MCHSLSIWSVMLVDVKYTVVRLCQVVEGDYMLLFVQRKVMDLYVRFMCVPISTFVQES